MLFDNHNSNYPSGCPKFICMSIAVRVKVCRYAKICFWCNDPAYVLKFGDIKADKHKCVSRFSKSRYVCQNSSCNIHIWCWTAHLLENEESLKKFHQEIRTKFNLEFCFIANRTCKPAHSIPIDSALADNSMNNTEQPTVKLHSNEARKNLSSSQAFNKMKIKLKRQGINQQLRPIADGSPQFLLGLAEGNTRPLLHLYDTGCGSVLFCSDVPEKGLKGCVYWKWRDSSTLTQLVELQYKSRMNLWWLPILQMAPDRQCRDGVSTGLLMLYPLLTWNKQNRS